MAGKKIVAIGALTALAFAATALAAPSNGGFEKGNLNGWDRTEPGGGQWTTYTAADGRPSEPTEGTYAATINQGKPGLNILHRKLNFKDGRYLSFQLAYDNEGGSFKDPKSFKFNGAQDNQQLRVDLLDAGAKIKSLKNADILHTVFRTKENTPLASPYEFYFLDLKELGIKRKFQLRFAEVDNMNGWFVGVDQVFQSDQIP